ncbi:MAG: transcription elongation factor GreA [Eubacteriales bacterium]
MAENTKQQYTKSGYQELVAELERRKTQDREKIREDIAIAKGFGDLSENAEYDAARTAQAENEARINELENLIENAIVVDENSLETGIISLGSVVILHDMDDDEDITYSIVGSNEVDPLENKISDLSPIGHAIMGKRAGDEVQVEVPNGSVLRFQVVDVTRRSHD